MLADRGAERRVPFALDYPADDFAGLLDRLAREEAGELPAGWVRHGAYWLLDAGAAIVAFGSLRHALTDRLRRVGGHLGYGVPPSQRRRGYATESLRLMLAEARAHGIERALLTCDKDSVGSVRTIVANGGVLDDEECVESEGHVVQRYWIDIA